jgi:hypothetical protein
MATSLFPLCTVTLYLKSVVVVVVVVAAAAVVVVVVMMVRWPVLSTLLN